MPELPDKYGLPDEYGQPGHSERDLRGMLADAAKADLPNRLDAGLVITRSRARRRPKQLVAAGMGALALAGVFVIAVQAIPVATPTSQVGESADSGTAPLTESAAKRAPADRINLCTASLAEVAPSAYGLRLDVEFPTSAPSAAGSLQGTVRLTNTSSKRMTGYTPATPAVTLSQGGIVLWHSNGPTILSLVAVDLGPGESLTYPASVTLVRCGIDDDSAESFSENLPALEAGDYELSALIDFTPSTTGEAPELDLVGGPLSPIVLT